MLPQPNKPNDTEYSMPLVPLLPCLGIIGNHALVGSFDLTTWIYYAVFLKIGIIIYFTYSVHHSILETGPRPEYDGCQVINEEIIQMQNMAKEDNDGDEITNDKKHSLLKH